MEQKLSRSQKRHQQQLRKDAAAVLAHPPTMRFLARMLDECGYSRNPFTGDSKTFFKCGEQMTGGRIVSALEDADPDALLKLLQAAAEARGLRAAITEDERDDE